MSEARQPEIQPIEEKPVESEKPIKDGRKLSDLVASVQQDQDAIKQAQQRIDSVKTIRLMDGDTCIGEIDKAGLIRVDAILSAQQAKKLAAWINEVIDV